jgi:hypothetical protein
VSAPLPYRCEFGYMCQSRVDFAKFDEALAFLRGFMTSRIQSFPSVAHAKYGCPIRLINHTNIDGADDASPAAQHGLTADEWERVQEVG